jgi:hypothetical protein
MGRRNVAFCCASRQCESGDDFEVARMTQFPPWLELAKAFAGPFATIIASVVAVSITACYARLQWKTAEKQAETALDQLRYNLFAKRYAIYEDVKQLLKLLINESHKPEFNSFEVVQHYVAMDEAIFFSSEETCDWLKSIQEDCQQFLEGRASKNTAAEYKAREDANRQIQLVAHFRDMPERFRKELGFRQLSAHHEPNGAGS